MNILENTPQGSPAWLAIRTQYDTASEAPAACGESKYQSRAELLKQKATGLTPDVGGAKQALFNRGHESESSARAMAEAIIGSELFPVTATLEIDGLKLLASMDGATMDEAIIWEHKLYSDKLAATVRAGALEKHYTIQMDQQLLVSGASKCLFMTSDGTEENMAWCWYEPSPAKFDALVAGWKQFRSDLAAYEPPAAAAPLPTGRAPETLPALRLEVTGMVTGSNLDVFKAHALAVFAGINRELSTDAQFADAEKTVKWCADVEDRLAAAKQHALSQTASIDELFRTVDEISAEARRVRLDLDKLVKARKEAIRGEIVAAATEEWRKHLEGLNTRLGRPYMPIVATDFPGVIKGKRTIDSLHDAVNTELARAKIAANEVADRLHVNLNFLRENAADFKQLFPDTASIIQKAPDDLTMLVKSRIAEHQAEVARKEEETRARIRAEEVARLAREQAEHERNEANAKEKAQAEAEKNAREQAAPEQAAKPAEAESTTVSVVLRESSMFQVAAPAATPPTLKLEQIGERLGFALKAEFLESLGFKAVATVGPSKLYHEEYFSLICDALVEHILQVQARQAA